MTVSKYDVWDDVTMVSNGYSWCDTCKVDVAPKNNLSKLSMWINELPLKTIFLYCVPCTCMMCGISGYNYKNFLFLVDPVSRYCEALGVKVKYVEESIQVLNSWSNLMIKKGNQLLMFIRDDVGTNFTTEEFKTWCNDNNITLSNAGPTRQEQNVFVEQTCRTSGRLARVYLYVPIFPHLSTSLP